MDHAELTGTIIRSAMTVHRALGPGFLESVYRNALASELRATMLRVEREQPIQVRYRGIVVGDFFADLVVADEVIVEIKAVRKTIMAHEVQLVNYLTATGHDLGLLLNFGAGSLEIKRKWRRYRDPDTNSLVPDG